MISMARAWRGIRFAGATCLAILVLPGAQGVAPAPTAEPPEPVVVRTDGSPFAKLHAVDLASVRLTEGFWAGRAKQTAEVTLRTLWDLAADPDQGHVLQNFRIAAGLAEGEYAGTTWQDEWLYKWIEAAACLYRATGDPWIGARMDEAIDIIARAQESDGFIATQTTVRKRPRFEEHRDHEVYNMGHLLTAGAIHRRMTGKTSLLNVAVRTADFLCDTLGVSVDPSFAHNPSAIMGMVELYRETGNRRYLDCARLIVDRRGANPKRGGMFSAPPGIAGTDQIQDRVPLRKSREVVGHNVFFTYLYAGAADVFLENGDATIDDALKRLWDDFVFRKMTLNGGVSPMGVGVSGGYFVAEAVGPAYFLPSASAYNETCGQIGMFLWTWRMLCAGENAAYADLMEQEMY